MGVGLPDFIFSAPRIHPLHTQHQVQHNIHSGKCSQTLIIFCINANIKLICNILLLTVIDSRLSAVESPSSVTDTTSVGKTEKNLCRAYYYRVLEGICGTSLKIMRAPFACSCNTKSAVGMINTLN